MKILSIEQVRKADEYTIKNEPIASIDLMERAGKRCFKWIRKKFDHTCRVLIFCGPGNNGGDGLVVARQMANEGCEVRTVVVKFTDNFSEDFKINLDRLKETGSTVQVLDSIEGIPDMVNKDLVVDAIFGSGLSRPVKGFPAEVIKKINQSDAITVSIDIPSGLYADKAVDAKDPAIIMADHTISFQFPKLAFMFPGNAEYVGEWHVEPIGLLPEYIKNADTKNYYLDKDLASSIYRPRGKFTHKGNYGHALLIAGGYGKMGAAVLAAKACLNTGAGLVHTHVPVKGYSIIQTAVPDAMVSIDPNDEYFSEVPDLAHYNAIGTGPGLGFAEQTKNALKLLIQNTQVPIVFDADALTILGENKTWIPFVPKLSIFTPHPKEFSRLVGSWKDDFERLAKQREFSVKYTAYVVLKGAHTSVTCPDGSCYFNSTGNPGMATGGSGDVLTGMILSLLAQNYNPKHAALLGVYLHGLAGDLAARKYGMEAVTASLMTDFIGKAFKKIYCK
jgi:NAD(P)H-hydrate epimerase